jgi:uncharacterized protein
MIRLPDLRQFAVSRSLFAPTTLRRAIERLGFVQADPIRAPARAQDLILRHRVRGYRVADLERRYPTLAIEEDYFVNYGFLPNGHVGLFHPRTVAGRPDSRTRRRIADLLAYARDRDEVHPRDAATYFAHGRVTNYWGGASRATTHLLDRMHYEGLLRVARRDNGMRVYSVRRDVQSFAGALSRQAQADTLLELAVRLYAPLPGASLRQLAGMLRRASPQLSHEIKTASDRANDTFARATIGETVWYWPADEVPADYAADSQPTARLLAPFDPIVWDRRRLEELWGWVYRFEAYVPPSKRKLGYYALPLLWRDNVIGWGNLSVKGNQLIADVGYLPGRRPKERIFRNELNAELQRIEEFLRLNESKVRGEGKR